jgi:hypothetical protein
MVYGRKLAPLVLDAPHLYNLCSSILTETLRRESWMRLTAIVYRMTALWDNLSQVDLDKVNAKSVGDQVPADDEARDFCR